MPCQALQKRGNAGQEVKMLYLAIDKEFFDKNKQKFLKEAKKDDLEDTYLIVDERAIGKIEEFDFENSTIIATIENSKIGYIDIKIKLETEDLIKLIEFAVKKLNRFKNILESLK